MKIKRVIYEEDIPFKDDDVEDENNVTQDGDYDGMVGMRVIEEDD